MEDYAFEPNEETVLIIDCDGREKDAETVDHGMAMLGFKTHVLRDLSADAILRAVADFAEKSKNIFICVILAAGSTAKMRAKDGFLNRRYIMKAANAPSLSEKAKLLVFDGELIGETTGAEFTWTPADETLEVESTLMCAAFATEKEPESRFIKEFCYRMLDRLEISDLLRAVQNILWNSHIIHETYKGITKHLYLAFKKDYATDAGHGV